MLLDIRTKFSYGFGGSATNDNVKGWSTFSICKLDEECGKIPGG